MPGDGVNTAWHRGYPPFVLPGLRHQSSGPRSHPLTTVMRPTHHLLLAHPPLLYHQQLPHLTAHTVTSTDWHRAPQTRLSLLPAMQDMWSVYAVLAVSGACGHSLGKYPIGKTLSAPICAMAIPFVLTALQVLPLPSPEVGVAQGLLVTLATPLLLFNADIRAVGRRAGRMVPAFLLGAIGTSVGALLAVRMLSGPLLAAFGADGLKVAAALAAKNIGGGINFVAVAAALQVSPLAFTAALAIDNVMALAYFPAVAALGRGKEDPVRDESVESHESVPEYSNGAERGVDAVGGQATALAIGCAVTAVSRYVAGVFAPGYALPIATMVTVAAATIVPQWLQPLASTATSLGTTCLFLFFASAGWLGGDLGGAVLLRGGPVLLAYLMMLYSVHLATLLGIGTVLQRAFPSARRIQRWVALPQLLVASNANIGGPATACALADGNKWPSLVTPALLIGNLGYAIATPLAILLFRSFSF